jgi:hypothetical protein
MHLWFASSPILRCGANSKRPGQVTIPDIAPTLQSHAHPWPHPLTLHPTCELAYNQGPSVHSRVPRAHPLFRSSTHPCPSKAGATHSSAHTPRAGSTHSSRHPRAGATHSSRHPRASATHSSGHPSRRHHPLHVTPQSQRATHSSHRQWSLSAFFDQRGCPPTLHTGNGISTQRL